MKKTSAALIGVLVLILTGCRHPDALIPEEHPAPWTPTEIENMLVGEDPWEPFNRCMFTCTDFTMNYLADPLVRIYTTILPRPVIEHFDLACINLEYPDRVVSCLLRKEWDAAGDESLRFLANTTLGVAGLFDVGWYWFHLPSTNADMGQTFAAWGIGPGDTLVLPLMKTTNRRDLVGFVFDMALDLKTYIPYAGMATVMNRLTMAQRRYAWGMEGSPDPYKNFRLLMALNRETEIRLWRYRYLKRQLAGTNAGKTVDVTRASTARMKRRQEKSGDEVITPVTIGKYSTLPKFQRISPFVDSLRLMRFGAQQDNDYWYMRMSFFNSDYVNKAKKKAVELVQGRDKMHYSLWLQPGRPDKKRQRLIILLPGIGGDCLQGTLVALSELFYRAGFNVVGMDSTMNWRFVKSMAAGELPGYLPNDAAAVRLGIKKILRDLAEDKLLIDPELYLCGYSLGGIQALKIMEIESGQNDELGIKRCLAINPPVSLYTSLKKIDEAVCASSGIGKSAMKQLICEMIGGGMVGEEVRLPAYDSDNKNHSNENYRFQIPEKIGQAIVGLYLKMPMRDMLMTAHRQQPLPELPAYSWWRRNGLYRQIDNITLSAYAEKILFRIYGNGDFDNYARQCDLHSLESFLRQSSNILVFHNYDDFLLNEAERQWLDRTLRQNILWFSNGGHLGSLYYKSVQKALVEALK